MRRLKRKFKRPRVAFNTERIEDERKVLREYGLRRKKELWITEAILRGYRQRARSMIASKDLEGEKILMEKLQKVGVLKKGASLDDVLALTRKDFLDRRLQTMIFKRGLAKTLMQARQMIVHGKICIDGQKVRYPSYLMTVDDEGKVEYKAAKKGGKHAEKASESQVPAEGQSQQPASQGQQAADKESQDGTGQ